MSKRVNNKKGAHSLSSREYGHPTKVRAGAKGERYGYFNKKTVKGRAATKARQPHDMLTMGLRSPGGAR